MKRFPAAASMVAVICAAGCSKGDSKTNVGEHSQIDSQPIVESASFAASLDAAPNPSGKLVYFSAFLKDGEAALFRASSAGGQHVLVANGFVAPFGVAVSTDGRRVFVADSFAGDKSGLGRI